MLMRGKMLRMRDLDQERHLEECRVVVVMVMGVV
jgi:hypothetical protein